MNSRLSRWLFNLWLVMLFFNYGLIHLKNQLNRILKRWRKPKK